LIAKQPPVDADTSSPVESLVNKNQPASLKLRLDHIIASLPKLSQRSLVRKKKTRKCTNEDL